MPLSKQAPIDFACVNMLEKWAQQSHDLQDISLFHVGVEGIDGHSDVRTIDGFAKRSSIFCDSQRERLGAIYGFDGESYLACLQRVTE